MWGTVLIVASLAVLTKADYYTALADLEDLLETEAVLINTLDSYIEQQEVRLQQLKNKVKDYKKEHSVASGDVTNYLSNPINAYLLVKRLITDWKYTETLMNDAVAEDAIKNITNIKKYMKFPTDEDLTGAATALIRLQDTYAMDTSSVARGELNGVQYTTQLSSSDCFELGRQSYNKQDFYHTMLWMREALTRHERELNRTETTRSDILEYLAYSTYMQGNLQSALEMTNELLEIIPDHPRALGNKAYYKNAIDKGELEKEVQDDERLMMLVQGELTGDEYLDDKILYEKACRGEVSPPENVLSQLKCLYLKNNPFLKLAPLKVEEAYLKPRILLFKDSLYDSEIEVIKRMAQPKLRRATVQNSKTGELETASYRISKSAWLKDNDDEVIARVSKRVEDMTGLTTATAEELQVVNYGIGGHYEPHFDFARKDEEPNAFKSLGTGNRIATVLFYMSSVAQGGATVFPRLRVSLWPEKGTAAVWFNLLRNGEGDYDTKHGACPVLAGSKWVSNKWLHVRGQEFLRPCSLEPHV
ncbi:prolyl 4-hydroxylase subunit alpha-2 isoform X2 [Cimex lectularius]|uniref:procollagen-proline 4-dioxygenase n=1 Tax=Cimex lectularius TaxID=79782 RepID=A0A8I6SIY3_CIMLE|nr:prolyl 4-hydroxylase subunit alpha-2 isoform X2 [Cimex lectularius]